MSDPSWTRLFGVLPDELPLSLRYFIIAMIVSLSLLEQEYKHERTVPATQNAVARCVQLFHVLAVLTWAIFAAREISTGPQRFKARRE